MPVTKKLSPYKVKSLENGRTQNGVIENTPIKEIRFYRWSDKINSCFRKIQNLFRMTS